MPTSSSSAMRCATVRAASRRGWVWAIIPSTPRPSSRQILGIWVVFPEPVSPATTTTWWSPIAASSSSRCAETGSSGGYSIRSGLITRPTICRGLLPVLARLLAVHHHDGLLQHLRHARAVREHVRLLLRPHARDQDRLRLAVLLDALRAVAHADAGLAGPAERQLLRRVVDDAVVHAGVAGLDARGQPLALVDVLGPYARVQPVARVVGQPDGLLLVAHLHDRQRRAERLLGHAQHRVVDVGEDGRLEEVALALAALAAHADLRALLDGVVDVLLDQVDLRRPGHRPHVD